MTRIKKKAQTWHIRGAFGLAAVFAAGLFVAGAFGGVSPLGGTSSGATDTGTSAASSAGAADTGTSSSDTTSTDTTTSSQTASTLPYIVTFASGTSTDQQTSEIAAAGATDTGAIAPLSMHAIDVPSDSEQAVVSALQSDADVADVERDHSREAGAAPNDPRYVDQWNLPMIGWDQIYGVSNPIGSSTIAVLDTGVSGSTTDLNLGSGWSAFGADPTNDPNGHGTAVASIAAATANNGIGIAGVGLGNVTLLPVQVLDSNGLGQDSDIIQGVVWAADHGANVILMSFSNPGYSQALQDAVSYAWGKGAVVVAATGNDDSASPTYPAGDAGVMGVAGTDQSDQPWANSNTGADTFLAAPATNIPADATDGSDTSITGTSASAAMVAGAAALLQANDPLATNAIVDGRLARNADPVGTSDQTGNGRLNLARAVADTSTDPVTPLGAPGGGPFVGPYVAAANNDANISPEWAPGNTSTVFNTLYRVTTGGTVQHVRVTLPAGYTSISAGATAFSSGAWGTPAVNQANRTVDVSLTGGTGLVVGGWARIDIQATTPTTAPANNGDAQWLMQTFTDTSGTLGQQNDQPAVNVINLTNPSATITFVDGSGNPITNPVLQNGVASTVRARITSTGSGIKYIDVAVPTCFSSPTGVTTTSSAGGNGGYAPTVTDGFIRMPGGSIPNNGFLTVQFTTTPNCTSGVYTVTTSPSTNATNPPSGLNQTVSETGGSLTVAAGLADLSITKTDSPDPVQTGGTLTYTIGVHNAGPDDASAVKVVDTLPPGVTFVSATGTNWVCNNVSGTVTCNHTGGNLATGDAPNITIVVTAPSTTGAITNTATVSSPNDNTPGNDTATATTTVANNGTIELKKAWVGSAGQTTLQIGTSAGGSQTASQQTGANGAAPLTTGQKSVTAGPYFVSETGGLANYTASLACFNDNGAGGGTPNNGIKDGTEPAVTPGLNNSVPVGSGDHIICTFTNTRQQGTIELKKAWVGTAGQTTLQIGTSAGGNGTANQQTGANGGPPLTTGPKTVDTGTFFVSETGGLTNYDSSLACFNDNGAGGGTPNNGIKDGTEPAVTPGLNNSVPVGSGDHIICTFTNTRQQGTIELKKAWVGTAGQTTLQIGTSAGGNGTANQQTGANGGPPLTTGPKTVDTGTFFVSETGGLTNYDSSLACFNDNGAGGGTPNNGIKDGTEPAVTPGLNNSVPVGSGDHIICTFTNTRQTGQIQLKKHWVGGAAAVTLEIKRDSTLVASGTANGADGQTSNTTVDTGSYTLNETYTSGSQSDYESTITCVDNATGHDSSGLPSGASFVAGTAQSVDIHQDDQVTCTITNKRKPQVKVIKSVVSSRTDTGKFNLQVNGSTQATDVGDGGTTGFVNVAVGSNPTVGELAGSSTSLSDYEASISCDNTAAGSNSGPLSVGTLGAGDQVTCTITNKRKPQVKVIKSVVSSRTDTGKFNLQVNGSTQATDVGDGGTTGFVNVAVGSNPTVGELAGSSTSLSDYEASISCDNTAAGSNSGPLSVGTLGAGDQVTCTITNKRKPQVKVIKSVVSSRTDTGKFNLQVNGSTQATDVGDGGTTGFVNVAVGSNPTVGELAGSSTSLSDYEASISCDNTAAGSNSGPLSVGTLGAGDQVTCTITNKRKPQVKVIKSVVSSRTDTGKFNLQVNGSTQATDVGDGGTTGFVNVAVGSNPTVGELAGSSTSLSDYEASISCDNTAAGSNSGPLSVGTLGAGDQVTCTITNKRKPQVKVIKSVVSSRTDTGKFNLQVNGSTQATDVGDGGTTGFVNVAVGSNPTVGELAGSSTSLSDYEASISCDNTAAGSNSGPLSVGTLGAGDQVTCTITNKRKPQVKVIKSVVSSRTDTGKFNLQVNGSTQATDVGDGGTTGFVNVAVGSNPTVGELAGSSTSLSDYEASISCDNTAAGSNSGPLSVGTLGAGDQVTCTITNKRKPQVKVIKSVVSSRTDTGKFNLQVNGSTQATDVGDGGTTGFVNVAVGSNPTVGELAGSSTSLSDYEASISCDNTAAGSNSGPLSVGTLGAGDQVTCTITNKRKPQVKVIKSVVSSRTDTGKFNLQVNGSTQATDVGDGGTTGFVNVAVGSNPTVGELAGSSTSLSDYEASISCDNTAAGSNSGPLSVGTLGAGDQVTCTITNKRKPQVKVIKSVVSSRTDTGKFNLQVNGSTQATDVGDGGTTGFVNVAVGSNPTVGELAGSSTSLSDYEASISCDNTAAGSNSGPLSVGTLGAGDQVTCTITNKRKPQVKVIKSVVSSRTDTGKFNLQVNGSTQATDVGDGGTTGFVNVAVGSNPTVGELAGSSTSLSDYEASISCDNTAAGSNSGPLSVGTLGAGDQVTCTITNKRKPQVKVIKSVVSSRTDTGKFNLQVNGSTQATDVGDGGTTGFVNVAVGSNPTVGELAGSSTSLSDYEASISCDNTAAGSNSGPLSVGTLGAGDQVTCTITNKRKPQVKVIKSVVSSRTDTGKFNLQVNGSTQATDVGDGGTTGFVNVAVGSNPTVGELAGSSTSLSDYEASISCDNTAAGSNSGPLSVGTLGAGDQVTCTITNHRLPRLEVAKTLVPSGDGGRFNLKIDNTVYDNSGAGYGNNGNTGFVNVSTGAHTVSETANSNSPTTLADYDSSVSCDNGAHNTAPAGGSSQSTGNLAYGDVVTCTITNHRLPRLTLTKSLDPSSDAGKFNLKVDSTSYDNSGGGYGNGGSVGPIDISTGSHSLSEAANSSSPTTLTDYDKGISCTDASNHTVTAAASGDDHTWTTPSLAYGDQVSCTITNHRLPRLEVAKTLVPSGDGGRFNLKIDNTVYDNSGAGYGNNGNTGFVNVSTGAHTVSETANSNSPTTLADYDSSVSCDNGAHNTAPAGGSSQSTGNLAYGDVVTCTITNHRLALISGMKFNDQNSDRSKIGDSGISGWKIRAYSDTNGNNIADTGEAYVETTTGTGGAYTFELKPGNYVICEVGQSNWLQTLPNPSSNSQCSAVSSAGGGYAVTVGYGDVVTNRDFGNTTFGSTSTMTDSSFQLADDLTPWTITDFEILLNPSNTIVATNPGQFYYHQRAVNTSGGSASMSFTINWPCQFTTQTVGGQPIHAYVQYAGDSANTWRDFTGTASGISWMNSAASSCDKNSSAGPLGQGKITVNGVPANAKVWVTVHLDYNLKGLTAPSGSFGTPPITYTPFTSTAAISNTGVSTSNTSLLGRGKKVTLAYGTLTDSSGTPLNGVWVRLTQGSNVAIGQTGADGQYIFYDGENCAVASFIYSCSGASSTVWNFAKGNGSTKVDLLGDVASFPGGPALIPTYPYGKTGATVKSGTTMFATLTAPNGYTFSVANGSAYNRDWKFGS